MAEQVFVNQRAVLARMTTTVTDMTPEAARAAIEIARHQYAVPAQEETKRAAEVTKQVRQPTWRVAICGGVLVLGFIAMIIRPEIAGEIAKAVMVLEGAFGGAEIVSRLREKKAPPELPPKGGG